MTQRIQLSRRTSEPYQQLLRLHTLVEKAAADAGLEQRLIDLVKIRGSMLNGCAFCLDLHSRNARKLGETERRIYLLGAWRETSRCHPNRGKFSEGGRQISGAPAAGRFGCWRSGWWRSSSR